MRNFKSLNIWHIVRQALAAILSVKEKYGLRSQICGLTVSISSKITEGCSRNSQKDFKFLINGSTINDY